MVLWSITPQRSVLSTCVGLIQPGLWDRLEDGHPSSVQSTRPGEQQELILLAQMLHFYICCYRYKSTDGQTLSHGHTTFEKSLLILNVKINVSVEEKQLAAGLACRSLLLVQFIPGLCVFLSFQR